jgi:hypothetical protein
MPVALLSITCHHSPAPPPPQTPLTPQLTTTTPATCRPGLRGPEELRWLAALAALPHISLLASVDHWSAGLLWDKAAAARCCWAWHHTPTFAPYAAETLDSPFILAGGQPPAGHPHCSLLHRCARVCGACLWCMCVVHVCGACVWCVCVVHVCGACVWCMCVVHVCGACVWCMCVVHVCGACVWCMCVVHAVA